ncbi:polyketide synthase, partial [Nostoc sp. CENA67]
PPASPAPPALLSPLPEMNPAIISHQLAQESKMQPTPEKAINFQRVLESLEYLLTKFQQNQAENLQAHGTYLNHQMEYTKTFFQLMQQQHALFANTKSSTETAQLKQVVMESVERSMMQFHAQQGETLRIHEQYLQEQVEYARNFFQLIQQEYSQLLSQEETTQLPKTPANGVSDRQFVPFTIATPVTEAPVPPTAKIVESQSEPVQQPVTKNGSKVAQAPVAPVWEIQPEPVAPVPAPAPVVEPQPEVVVKISTFAVVETTPEPALTITAPIAVPNINVADLGKNLLAITSEKTGYPVEMLELDMDMEADLGIDSIKRVEILGALQEMYPDLPKPNLEELAEKRTIGQVVEYLQSHAAKSVSVEIAINQVQDAPVMTIVAPAEVTVITAPEPVVTPVITEIAETASNEYADLGQTLLAITSEKTGYPVEMLELDMDMEADLGIDSIKRVEILGAMQEMYPNLPKPNVEELGELRTIGQIVDYLQRLVGGEKKKSQPQFDFQPVQIIGNVARRPAKLKFLPPPDSLDFTLPEGHIGLITDDGSLTTSQVAKTLVERGWKVVVLSFPQSLIPQQAPLPAGVNRITLADMSEELLQHKLLAIATNFGSIGALIHIHPVFQTSHTSPISYLEQDKAIVKHVFFIAKHLKKSLNEAARYERSCFLTVTRLDGAFGLEHNTKFGAIAAGLFGLVKTLRWEWPRVFARAIDLSPALDAQLSAQHIIAELHDPNLYISEVAYGSQGRVTLTTSFQK